MGGAGSDRPEFRRSDARDREALQRLRLLLDTHVALWWINDPGRLQPEARAAIADSSTQVAVSAASVWEVAIKEAAGRLATPRSFATSLTAAGFAPLPILWAHADRVRTLPDHHRDPFDRILIAQAMEEAMVLVTRDPKVRRYELATMPA